MDRVKLHAQERLDLDDARALQSLVYDYVQEALGGLFGHTRGALSMPVITQVENNGAPYITLSPFQFVSSAPMDAGVAVSGGVAHHQHRSIVVSYDATEEASAQISITNARAYYQDYVGAYLWARPISVDTDQATRIRWSVSGGAEQTFSAETRESQRVAFAIQTNEPSYAEGEAKWSPIAKITAWTDANNSGSLAVWSYVSAYEHDDARVWMGSYVQNTNLTSAQTGLANLIPSLSVYPQNSNQSFRGFGVADQLAILRYKIAQLQGFGENDPATTPTTRAWYAEPLISLGGANTAISDINTQFAERTSSIVCIATCTITMRFSVAGNDYFYQLDRFNGVERVDASPLRSSRVCIELTSDLLAEPWKIEHISCTQLVYRQENQNQANTYDYNRATFLPDFVGTGNQNGYNTVGFLNDSANYRLDDYATTSGRGINIEILPHFHSAEEAIPDQHGNESHSDVFISEGASDLLRLDFSVAIFARHQNQI